MQCGWCSVVTALMRRAMCVGGRRGSGDSYQRDVQEPDTVRLHVAAEFLDQPAVKPTCLLDGIRYDGVDHYIDSSPESESLCYQSGQRKLDRFHTLQRRTRKSNKSLQECCLLDAALHGQVQIILSGAALWRFNMFSLDNTSGGRSIPMLCVHLFHHYGLFAHFRLDTLAVWKLFSLIEEGYRADNPYHNATHAADVAQAMHCFMQQSQILAHLEPIDVLACIVGAVAHDVEHPGLNQTFLIAQQSHLAILYRNESVLENHHWRAAMSCLAQSGVLQQLRPLRARLQRTVRDLVLATDITRQHEFLARFKMYLDGNTLDLTRMQDRHFILQMALKCADISNPCRRWSLSRIWSLAVCEEFYLQGDLEKRMNFPVTPIFDRNTTSIPKIQVGFLEFVVTPLVREWHRFLRSDLSLEMLQNLSHNLNRWGKLVVNENTGRNVEICSKEINTASLVSFSSHLRQLFYSYKLTSTENYSSKELPIPLELQDDSECNHLDSTSSLHTGTNEAMLRSSNFHKNSKNYTLLSCNNSCSKSAISISQYNENNELNKYCNVRNAARDRGVNTDADSLSVEVSANLIIHQQINKVRIPFFRQRTFPPSDAARNERHANTHPSVEGCPSANYNIGTGGKNGNTNSVRSSTKGPDGLFAQKKHSKDTDKREWYSVGRRSARRRESAPVGSRLEENLASVPLSLGAAVPAPRRSSEPSVLFKNGDPFFIGSSRLKAVSSVFGVPDAAEVPAGGRRRGSAPVLGSVLRFGASEKPFAMSSSAALVSHRSRRQCHRTALLGEVVYIARRRSSLPAHCHSDSDRTTDT